MKRINYVLEPSATVFITCLMLARRNCSFEFGKNYLSARTHTHKHKYVGHSQELSALGFCVFVFQEIFSHWDLELTD